MNRIEIMALATVLHNFDLYVTGGLSQAEVKDFLSGRILISQHEQAKREFILRDYKEFILCYKEFHRALPIDRGKFDEDSIVIKGWRELVRLSNVKVRWIP